MDKPLKVICVGSPIIDRLAHVDENALDRLGGNKGGMQLVKTDEMTSLMERLQAPVAVSPGGSAANTAFGLARLDVPAAILGKVGDDGQGRFYRRTFEQTGGDSRRIKKCRQSATASCLCLITPDSERTMRTDLGAAAGLQPAEVSAGDFAGCHHAHVEGYLLFNPALASAVLSAAREAGCTVSLDLGSYEVVDANLDTLPGLLSEYVDLVMANEDEAAAFCRTGDPMAGLDKLSEHVQLAAVKLGARGAQLKRGGRSTFIPAFPVGDPVDATGAGDFWAAGFLYGRLAGYSPATCGRFGAALGAEAVRHVGASLPLEAWERVADRFADIKCHADATI